jgi:hypothetical protein
LEDRLNPEFFERLHADKEFCSALGKMALAAGRFESDLRAFLAMKGVHVPEKAATLGRLTAELQKHDLLSKNGVTVLKELNDQRNYLIHSLFDLFSGRVGETLLPRTDLVPEDVELFTEKAWQLQQNLRGLSSIAEQQISKLSEGAVKSSEADDYLFRP